LSHTAQNSFAIELISLSLQLAQCEHPLSRWRIFAMLVCKSILFVTGAYQLLDKNWSAQ
jgi:hypothetical protein